MNQLKHITLSSRPEYAIYPITTMKIRKETNMKHMKRLKYTIFFKKKFCKGNKTGTKEKI